MSFWSSTVRDAVSSQITAILVPRQGIFVILIVSLISLHLWCSAWCYVIQQIECSLCFKSFASDYLRSYWYCFQILFLNMLILEITVLFNVYGPRADPEDVERIQFKANFYKILQVYSIHVLKYVMPCNNLKTFHCCLAIFGNFVVYHYVHTCACISMIHLLRGLVFSSVYYFLSTLNGLKFFKLRKYTYK